MYHVKYASQLYTKIMIVLAVARGKSPASCAEHRRMRPLHRPSRDARKPARFARHWQDGRGAGFCRAAGAVQALDFLGNLGWRCQDQPLAPQADKSIHDSQRLPATRRPPYPLARQLTGSRGCATFEFVGTKPGLTLPAGRASGLIALNTVECGGTR
jgi:hypothetical protein